MWNPFSLFLCFSRETESFRGGKKGGRLTYCRFLWFFFFPLTELQWEKISKPMSPDSYYFGCDLTCFSLPCSEQRKSHPSLAENVSYKGFVVRKDCTNFTLTSTAFFLVIVHHGLGGNTQLVVLGSGVLPVFSVQFQWDVLCSVPLLVEETVWGIFWNWERNFWGLWANFWIFGGFHGHGFFVWGFLVGFVRYFYRESEWGIFVK